MNIAKIKKEVTGLRLSKGELRKILIIVIPAFVELVLSQLFSMVDTVMLGQSSLSYTAIASVGLTNNPVHLVIGVTQAFFIGTTAAVSWSIGAGKRDNAKAVVRESLTLSVFIGTVAGLILYFFAGELVTFMGAKSDTYEYAKSYLQMIAWGIPFQVMTMCVTASMRGAGLTRFPMVYNLIANASNVLMNYLLIYGIWIFPELGVKGAAIATSCSKIIAFVMAIFAVFVFDSKIKIKITESFMIRKDTLKRIADVGITAALEQFFMQSGFILFTKIVSVLPTPIFSAHQIGLSVNGLSWVPSQAYGVAATTLVGQALGAEQKDIAVKHAKIIHIFSFLTSAFMGIMFILFSKNIVLIYNSEPETVLAASMVLKLIALGLPGISTQIPIAAALRGAKDTLTPLIANFFSVWVFRVFVAYLFVSVFEWGIVGAWLTIVLDQTCRAIIVYGRFLSRKWLNKKITT